MNSILVVGSLAYDTIRTPAGLAERTLGGSANYFSLAASLFSKVQVVGVVGDDYQDFAVLTDRGVDTRGLVKAPGKTFHWSGDYTQDFNEAKTIATDLNVFAQFNPELPSDYRQSSFVFLANIDPVLQLKVLSQTEKPLFVGSDTMNFWIHSKKDILLEVLKKVDVLIINDGEARMLTENSNSIAAAHKILELGPKFVVIKRGEYGFVLGSPEGLYISPAFPIAKVIDPTGAGDTFAGGFFGYLASLNRKPDLTDIKQACIHGCILASFTVQQFGVKGLMDLKVQHVHERLQDYKKVVSI